MKKLVIIAIVLHFFIGVGALAGGAAAIVSPEEPLGMPADAMQLGPFTNYLIPGIMLFTIIGLGNIAAGIIVLKEIPNFEYVTGSMGALLLGWIVIQCIILLGIHFLHITFFAFGAVQGIIALLMLKKGDKFPWTLLS